VGEREDLFLISVVVLHGDLEIDTFADTFEIDDFIVQRFFVLVEVLNERNDAAGIVKFVLLLVALVFDRNEQSAIEKGEFSKTLGKNIEAECRGLEDSVVGLEADLGSTPIRMSGHLERTRWNAPVVALYIHLAPAPDLEIQPLRKRVNHGHTNAVQAARNFVCSVVEFSSRVKLCKNNLCCRLSFLRHDLCRYPAAVVDDGNRIVDVNNHVNFRAESCESFINGVVYDFIHEVVQSIRAGRTDIHRSPL